jgi:hypothetical protein
MASSGVKPASTISDHAANSFWPALFKKELEFEREFVKRGGLLVQRPHGNQWKGRS